MPADSARRLWGSIHASRWRSGQSGSAPTHDQSATGTGGSPQGWASHSLSGSLRLLTSSQHITLRLGSCAGSSGRQWTGRRARRRRQFDGCRGLGKARLADLGKFIGHVGCRLKTFFGILLSGFADH